MLYAIENNKASRNFTSEEINWRILFTTSEDSLTSSVLGTLLYLPDEHLWSILYEATQCHSFQRKDNRIESIDFWPSWDAKNTSNQYRVEPDVFIRTTHFDLLIEAKKEDCQHESQQWTNECIAYLNEYGADRKTLVFWALGGDISFQYEQEEVMICKPEFARCKWLDLLFAAKKEWEILEGKERDMPGYLVRIYNDVIKAFRIHGFMHIEWFSTFIHSPFRNIKSASANFFSEMDPLPFMSRISPFPIFKISNKSLTLFQIKIA